MSKKRSDLDITDEKVEQAIKEAFSKVARKPKVRCVCDDCGGRVVRRVSSLFRGQYHFSLPECESCKATYWGCDQFDSIPLGIEEFEQMMRQPFGW